MAITESSRNELHNALTARIGEQPAATLMEMLPPVGWADVATKRDLDHLEEKLASRIEHLGDRFESRFDVLRAEHASFVTQRDLRQQTYTLMAFMVMILLAVLGAAGLA